jgi:LuxR family transcriptional regulator of csgAB operon
MSPAEPINLDGAKIAIIGSMSLKQSLMSYYFQEIGRCECMTFENIDELSDLEQHDFDVALWDVHDLSPGVIIRYLKSNFKNINTAFCLFDLSENFNMESVALRLKVKGFFYEGDPINLLPKGINQLRNGHIWAPRDILEKCLIDETKDDSFIVKGNSRLTERQEEVLRLIMDGYRNIDIAEKLQVSTNTVKAHLYQAYKKINVNSRWQATKWAEINLI